MAPRKTSRQQNALALKLTATERKMLGEPSLVFPEGFKKRLEETPVRAPVLLSQDELEDLADCLGEILNHAEDSGDRKLSTRVNRLLNKAENLLEESIAERRIFEGGAFDEAMQGFDPNATILALPTPPADGEEMSPVTAVVSIVLSREQRNVIAKMNTISDDVRQMVSTSASGDESFELNLRQAMVLTLAAAEAMYTGCSLSDAKYLEEIAEQLAGNMQDAPGDIAGSTLSPRMDTYYQLKITLNHTKPPIWRRVRVADCTLGQLHTVIQDAMGWTDTHLHSFSVGDDTYGMAEMDEFGDLLDEDSILLNQVFEQGSKKFRYSYDFGDDWQHTIQVESSHERRAADPLAVCIKGKRACPPEDCGGVWGYHDLLETISDSNSENYEEMMDWLGGPIDPEEFDIDEVNECFAQYQYVEA